MKRFNARLGSFASLSGQIYDNCSLIFQTHTQIQSAHGQNKESAHKRERKVTCMVFLMVLAFILAWTGYALVCILRLLHQTVSDTAVAWAMLLAKNGGWLNAIVFVFMNKQVCRYVHCSIPCSLG